MDARELKDSASENFRKGKFAKAAEAYLALTKLEPKELQHFIKLGDSYRRDGRKDVAIEAYREAVDGYARQGVMIKAIAACKLILEIDPSHKRAQEALAQLCAQRYSTTTKLNEPVPSTYRPKPQPTSVPETIELPEDDGESLELDGSDNRKVEAAPARPLPPLRHEPPKPPAPKGPPPRVEPVKPAVVVDTIEFDAEEPSARPPARTSPTAKKPDTAAEIELDIDLTPAVPAPPERKRTPGAELSVPAAGDDDVVIEAAEFVEDDELPPGITIVTAESTEEQEILSTAASAAVQPSTAMASILARASDPEEEFELLSVTTRPTAAPRGRTYPVPKSAIPTEEELFTPARRPAAMDVTPAEAHEVAHLVEEAAFDLVPSVADAAEAEPAATTPAPSLAIPSADIHQENVPLFSELPKDAFIDLLELLTFRRVPAGEVIVREGDIGKSIYVLASGQARVVKGHGEGHEIELAKLEEGAFFGEMALLTGAPRVASVIATQDSEVLELTETILRNLTAKHPSVGQSLKKFYRQRLLANVMAISPLFRAFDKADRKSLVEKFKLREILPEQRIITEGQPPDGLYVIMHGAALVTKNDAGNRRTVPLALLKEGDVFGEMSLLTKKPANASVIAKRKTLVLRLPKATFDELMFTHPAVLEVVSELSEQRTRVNEQILSGAADAPREALAFV